MVSPSLNPLKVRRYPEEKTLIILSSKKSTIIQYSKVFMFFAWCGGRLSLRQMERIELEIAKVNRDIETVTKQIEIIGEKADKVEVELEDWKQRNNWNEDTALTLQNNVSYKELREEKNKLREKESKLMEKESMLREEKNKLRELLIIKEKEKLLKWTFEKLLNYPIPTLSTYASTTNNKTGTVPTYPRDCGRSIESWDSFSKEVYDFYESSTVSNALATPLDSFFFLTSKLVEMNWKYIAGF